MLHRLIVMRHAEAASARDDHARPLTQRGQRQAQQIAQGLLRRDWRPQQVLASDARRTRETWELMAGLLPAARCTFDPQLYLSGRRALSALVQSRPPTHSCLLVLGHNPGWQEMASELCGQSLGMPPASAVLLELECEGWLAALSLDGCWRRVEQLFADGRPEER